MGRRARAEYERSYTSERNYDALMAIYDDVIRERTSTTFGPLPVPKTPS